MSEANLMIGTVDGAERVARVHNAFNTIREHGSKLALVGLFALGACNNDDSGRSRSEGATTSTTVVASETAEACGTFDLTANQADELFVDRSSIFPALSDKEGALLSKAKAVEVLQKQTGNDFRVAGVMSEIYNLRENRLAPDTLTLKGFESAMNTMKTNNESVADRVEDICNELSFAEPDPEFAIVGGNATEITFVRDENGVETVSLSTVDVDRVVRGFVLGANFDDANLKPEDIAFFRQFMEDVIVTDYGTILIRNLALDGGINVEDQEAEAPATPNPDESDNKAGANQDNETNQDAEGDAQGGGSTQDGNNQGGGRDTAGDNEGDQGEGGSAGPNGDNPEAGPGGVTDSPANGGPGTTEGGNGGPGTTTPGTTPEGPTTTRPSTTTTTRPPATTTTTQPPSTTTSTTTPPPPTTTTTTTPDDKGGEPPADCANNPYDPRC